MTSTSLKKQAIRGTIWTVFGYGTSQTLRFGSNLILTRLLVPELFGLMALVQVFITGLNLFSDIGIRPSIIRSDRGDDPVFLNTAWTIQVIRGFGLWLGCLIIALPVANYYDDPRLTWLIPMVGLSTIVSGFNSTSLASLNRHLEVGKLSLFELGIQVVSLVIMIVWAWLRPTIWALVGGNLISLSLMALLSHRLNSGKPNRFAWNQEVVREIASFGKWIFVSTAMTFLASQADRILLGKFFSLELLGVYIIAFTFADIPRQVSLKIGSKVIFPTISQLIDLPRKKLKDKIAKKRWQMLLLLAFIVTILFCFGDLVILKLYDARYEQAAWMLPILALGLWPLLLCTTIDRFLMAIGKPGYLACGNLLKFIYMVIGIPLGFSQMGILGAIIVIAFNDLPYYLAVHYGLWREKLTLIVQDFQASLLLIGAIASISIIRYMFNFGIPIDGIL
ncbi:oligosaccharide flippase family protein [Pleurocapsales cyanobacterium LEGE 10410]|nr:oligosaccharide flippase family protein [Pleurocapsales cyanobacterium LEGE 10410]